MPKQPTFTADKLTSDALRQFWLHGYYATSMGDLVEATDVSRHGIYSTFGSKKKLFLACFERHQDIVVSPAFSVVERPDADLKSMAAYFEFQISQGETTGLPGPGCFVANSATEVAPNDAETMAKVVEHNDRLQRGFTSALYNEFKKSKLPSTNDPAELAGICVVFANGLWSMSRTVSNANDLRSVVKKFLMTIKDSLT